MTSVRFALIGAGNIGRIYVEAFSHVPDGEITVVCDAVPAAGEALAASCGAEFVPSFADAVRASGRRRRHRGHAQRRARRHRRRRRAGGQASARGETA